jgi:hypothetical protein
MYMEMEDATRYLPHNPIGRNYQWFVYDGTSRFVSLVGRAIRNVVFTGSREECEAFIARHRK